ncbi:hypothetical protein ABGB12_30320 [Actinocorallia sp. B10E7]
MSGKDRTFDQRRPSQRITQLLPGLSNSSRVDTSVHTLEGPEAAASI